MSIYNENKSYDDDFSDRKKKWQKTKTKNLGNKK